LKDFEPKTIREKNRLNPENEFLYAVTIGIGNLFVRVWAISRTLLMSDPYTFLSLFFLPIKKGFTEKSGPVKFAKKITEKCNGQTSLVNANRFASKRYVRVFTVTFIGKSGNIY